MTLVLRTFWNFFIGYYGSFRVGFLKVSRYLFENLMIFFWKILLWQGSSPERIRFSYWSRLNFFNFLPVATSWYHFGLGILSTSPVFGLYFEGPSELPQKRKSEFTSPPKEHFGFSSKIFRRQNKNLKIFINPPAAGSRNFVTKNLKKYFANCPRLTAAGFKLLLNYPCRHQYSGKPLFRSNHSGIRR